MRSKGQVGLGGGFLDWGSKVVSALVVQPRVGRALLLVHSQPSCLQTLRYQQDSHTKKTHLEILINNLLTYIYEDKIGTFETGQLLQLKS